VLRNRVSFLEERLRDTGFTAETRFLAGLVWFKRPGFLDKRLRDTGFTAETRFLGAERVRDFRNRVFRGRD
jgi:predicted aspartyl protease